MSSLPAVPGPGLDDPAPVAPAPPALHPRYQGMYEQEDPRLPPYHVDLSKHDFTERRWLTPAHRAALADGTLDVPDRSQSEHDAVLVSVPDHFGSSVAWVDRGVAEVVLHAARLGAPTVESCENAGGGVGTSGHPDAPVLWFKGRRDLDRFSEITEGLERSSWSWVYPKGFGRLPRGRFSTYAVSIPTEDLPQVAAALRDKEV